MMKITFSQINCLRHRATGCNSIGKKVKDNEKMEMFVFKLKRQIIGTGDGNDSYMMIMLEVRSIGSITCSSILRNPVRKQPF